MSLARVLYVLGIIFMVWSVVSGIYVNYKLSDGEENFSSGYTFKAGLFIVGLLMAYIGRRSRSKTS